MKNLLKKLFSKYFEEILGLPFSHTISDQIWLTIIIIIIIILYLFEGNPQATQNGTKSFFLA
ncbi:hypothetical protein BpHYR1_037178 [Brachionus plicatilis]|uniref:Uncharacterized protein n=1 Tax=Brachionus plicatilis TaxID=10195 RepID=A0A3M7PGT9_BRAPC|nr:hypothetical protein BpHYR1_037178 [Brachionus plicatilis]